MNTSRGPVRRSVAGSVVLAAACLVLVPTPASAAVTCQGQEATLIGVPGQPLDGTPGPDVMVSNGANVVEAGDGDDVVCLTRMPDFSQVDAGEGDDGVVTQAAGYVKVLVTLGAGDDRFTGGAGRDDVYAYDPEAAPDRVDVISTGAGHDTVWVNQVDTDGAGVEEPDRIHLGADQDTLVLYDAGLSADARVNGGAGRDQLLLNFYDESIDVAIDAERRTVERDGPYLQGWVSFEDYYVDNEQARVTFAGSGAAEEFSATARSLVARMAGGADRVRLSLSQRADAAGGAGRDEVVGLGSGGHEVWIDLAAGRIGTVESRGRSAGPRIAGFEDATADEGRRPVVVGDSLANTLVAGCGTVRGQGGADRIVRNGPDTCRDFTAYGGRGNDLLVGNDGPDSLVGGPGRDEARGRQGRDRCVAEVRLSCER